MNFTRLKMTPFLAAVVLMSADVLGHETAEPAAMNSDEPTPLYGDLGDLTYPISTQSDQAQRYFDQGLRLTYAFNHAEALRAFREAQRLDPECAMCAWGEAFALGPNINAPMATEAIEPALAATRRAKALAHHATERELLLIAALEKRYSEEGPLAAPYAEAMGALARQFPEDQEIAVLYADSIMNLSPWDYWLEDGKTPKGKIGAAVATVERLLEVNPDHPAAIHLYLHLTEASANPKRAEPFADRLPTLMPGAGHLVHMAGHIFFRIGRYHDSVRVNRAAVRIDEAYLAQSKVENIYSYGYYPHNIHFVLASAQLAGDTDTAIEYAYRLEGKIPDKVAAEVGWIQVILAAPLLGHAQLSNPETVLRLSDPGEKFPMVRAMWHYARGVAYATQGNVGHARGEAVRIAELNRTADFSDLLTAWVPAPDVLRIARHVLEGRIARTEGNIERAVKEFETAVAIQDSLPYMEPPYWYYPVRQSFGAALLEAGRPEDAVVAFEGALKQFPNNGWALFGLMHAQRALGDEAAAAKTLVEFEQAWTSNPAALSLDKL